MKLLLIEDDLDLGTEIQKILKSFDFDVLWVRTLSNASCNLDHFEFDIAVVDFELPDGDGLSWVRNLRNRSEIQPVMILAPRDGVMLRVKCLEDGADDVLMKPFEVDELIARLRAMKRRMKGFQNEGLQINRLSLDESGRKILLNGEMVRLSPTEFDLTRYLLRRLGRVVSRNTLESLISDVESKSLDMHISNIRKKLGRQEIRTVRGFGYVVDKDAFKNI